MEKGCSHCGYNPFLFAFSRINISHRGCLDDKTGDILDMKFTEYVLSVVLNGVLSKMKSSELQC